MRNTLPIVPFLIALLGLGACGAQSVKVSVDSITAPAQPAAKHYVWRSNMPGVGENDLYFREFSRYFKAVLAQHGYRETPPGEADIAIFFSYGVSPGHTVHYTTSMPIYDWVGGDTFVYTETQKDAQGKVTGKTTRTVTTPVQQRLVGISLDSNQYTEYTRFVALEAKRWEPERKPQEMPTLWQTRISSIGPQSDLRALMPLLAAASAPYVGVNTGAAKLVKITPNDPRVIELQRQLSPPAAPTAPATK